MSHVKWSQNLTELEGITKYCSLRCSSALRLVSNLGEGCSVFLSYQVQHLPMGSMYCFWNAFLISTKCISWYNHFWLIRGSKAIRMWQWRFTVATYNIPQSWRTISLPEVSLLVFCSQYGGPLSRNHFWFYSYLETIKLQLAAANRYCFENSWWCPLIWYHSENSSSQ